MTRQKRATQQRRYGTNRSSQGQVSRHRIPFRKYKAYKKIPRIPDSVAGTPRPVVHGTSRNLANSRRPSPPLPVPVFRCTVLMESRGRQGLPEVGSLRRAFPN